MTVTLVIPPEIRSDFDDLLRLDVESGAVLLVRLVECDNGDRRLLATQLAHVPESSYVRRTDDELLIDSAGFVPALGIAAESALMPIWLHTHPREGQSARPSNLDLKVNEALAETFRIRSGAANYGALIIAPLNGDFSFTGFLDDGSDRHDIDRCWTVGERWRLVWNETTRASELPSLFDRNIRAFGGEVQSMLTDLNVAIIGCGGTGSSVAEQLARLGVRNFTVIDPDQLSESNVTRVYGSGVSDVGRPKVNVLAANLKRINPSCEVKAVVGTVTTEANARLLMAADVVFGCTDDNAGRMVLSRFSTFFLTPVIDCGVILTSDANGVLDGIFGRITTLSPGTACLICRNRIDLTRAASEMLTPEERKRLADEGYAPELAGIEPAVVAFTTAVGATAVGELLERATGYGVEPVPSEIVLRVHDREVSTNRKFPTPRHYCDAASGKVGLGTTTPFLEQTWSA